MLNLLLYLSYRAATILDSIIVYVDWGGKKKSSMYILFLDAASVAPQIKPSD